MASKGPRSKLDHESRAKRQKALEVPREPRRPKTHWDHVLEEMIWLSKDFEAERKWKLAQAKKVALRASRVDQETRGEKRMKEEEQRMRKVALNISKDVKKFWTKIEKLVLYKHQLERDYKKKKALDKQLEYLLGQTERYSTMLAENLLGNSNSCPSEQRSIEEKPGNSQTMVDDVKTVDGDTELLAEAKSNEEIEVDAVEADNDFDISSGHESEDDERTIEEDEALITEEEREEELAALQNEIDMPIEELLKRYSEAESNEEIEVDAMEADNDFDVSSEDESEDDEQTLEEDEALITEEERQEELAALENEKDLPLEELLKRYSVPEAETSVKIEIDAMEAYDPMETDDDFDLSSSDESEDDEQTVEEDEALITKEERQEELDALQNEMDLPLEELLKRYSVPVNGEENKAIATESSHGQVSPCQDNEMEHISEPKTVAGFSTKIYSRRRGKNNGPSKALCKDEALVPKTSLESMDYDFNDDQADDEFVIATGEDKDDETTLEEEEELEKVESIKPEEEIALLQKESEIPLEELLARYNNMEFSDLGSTDGESDNNSDNSDLDTPPVNQVLDDESRDTVLPENIVPEEIKDTSPVPEQECKEESQRDARIADAAAAARSAQPTGNTFSTNNVRTKLPFLIKHPLREYQHIGLDWLVTMYEKRLNGILADEMGLGKTIMTIALLAHLACEKGIWGPHLIVVPTSVMLNWETEFLKWCPAFKILTYFGSAKERKYKRQGWMKPNSFHVCITTYRLVIQDSKAFKRKKWKYLILDEAHLIKNWKSQRWQTLLNFNSKRRILLTGTPLQNDLMELWSLMHFLMPHIFQSHQEFKEWFCSPISGMVEGQEKINKEVIDRLHNVLRPFILRRLKRDVEKQLPMKHEHVIYCKLSKRQRNLYEDFIASSETQATLASSNFLGMLNVIMQLRKVCNHPDLFEGRSIVSSFDMEGIDLQLSSTVCSILSPGLFSSTNLSRLGFVFTHLDFNMTSWEYDEVQSIATPSELIEARVSQSNLEVVKPFYKKQKKSYGTNIFEEIQKAILEERLKETKKRAEAIAWWNSLRCRKKPVYSTTLREFLTIEDPIYHITCCKEDYLSYEYSSKLADIILSPVERFQKMIDQVESFMFVIPAARAPPPVCWCNRSGTSVFIEPAYKEKCSQSLFPLLTPIRPAVVRRQLYFPDRRLIQFDCGKLQQLAILLRRLKSEGHRALIFTQMTKMLDVLEAFINLYGYTYMRLDGSTQPEERQTLMQRFNTNPKIFLFILSTRSGGVGINLVGADTVIFYDSDWNPAMDQQAQDRCHRIGQTREVHIYRLISESTIEENILKKANQKRALDDLVIQSGSYNTEFFKKLDPMELFSGHRLAPVKETGKEKNADNGVEVSVSVSNADIEAALKNAEDEADYMALKKVEEEEAVDNQEFTEEAIGKVEDEDLGNEDGINTKGDESGGQNEVGPASNIENNMVVVSDLDKEKALTLACEEEDEVDMIADVKQMAAEAAAAGQEVLSFEEKLRPIDRYAMRFLEVWDPIIDKDAINYQVQIEEREWELERIEKLKEDMEAELDGDDEPLVYEKWDAEFATQAYHQQVEALAQHQLMEELENKAKEKEKQEEELIRNEGGSKSKSKKKKPKKAKFKSLKKNSLSLTSKAIKEEGPIELLSSDYEDISQEADNCVSTPSIILRLKRKKDEITGNEEETSKKTKSKKSKKNALVTMDSNTLHEDTRLCEDGTLDLDLKRSSRGKMGEKITITTLPLKRVYTIRPEKWKKKGNLWSSDCFPSPDSWLPQEDAVLCALVHEYGPNWSLVSDTLYGMSAGGFYRGRFRHPTVCCERFRELFQKYVNAVIDTLNNEKANATGPAKGLLKVTEENVRVLLDAAIEQPDSELLLQHHFTALLTSVWRMTSSLDREKNRSLSNNNLFPSIRLFGASVNPITQKSTTNVSQKKFDSGQCGKLISLALNDVGSVERNNKTSVSSQMEVDLPALERLDVTVEFRGERDESDESTFGFPSMVPLSITGFDSLPSLKIPSEDDQLRSTRQVAENRFRASSNACLHGFHNWASTTFPVSESRARLSLKSPSSGKHKLGQGEVNRSSKSKVRKVAEQPENPLPFLEPILQLLPTVTPNSTNPISSSYPSEIPGTLFDEHVINPPYDDQEETSSSNLEVVPHCYNPSTIEGLDDCPLTEYTDVG